MKDSVRLNLDFPRSEYPHLKMFLAHKHVTLREYVTEMLIQQIEEYEDEQLTILANKRLEEIKPDHLIPIEEAFRLAGWDEIQD